MLFWTVMISGIILVRQGAFSFPIPGLFRVSQITSLTWSLRFRLLTVELMLLPHFFFSLCALFFPLVWRGRGADAFDSLYLLKICKDRASQKNTKQALRKLFEGSGLGSGSGSSNSLRPRSAAIMSPASIGESESFYDLMITAQGTPLCKLPSHRHVHTAVFSSDVPL